jgi:hypothetical protein
LGLSSGSTGPERYLVYLFDDLNIDFADMVGVRNAASRHFQSLAATDRAAIYTVSGRRTLEFTGDRGKLEETVGKLKVQWTFGHGGLRCPDISYYLADLVLNKGDQQALLALIQHTMACAHVKKELAELMVRSAAQQELFVGE